MNPAKPEPRPIPAPGRTGPCAHLDARAIRSCVDAALASAGFDHSLTEAQPNLFSPHSVFATPADLATMRAVIQAIEATAGHPAYIAAALETAPETAHHNPGNPGAFFGYDFHLEPGGPKLIEINTNAGGMLLSLALLRAHLRCCEPLRTRLPGHGEPDQIESAVVEMLRQEWARAGRTTPLTRIAIVDETPERQFLYPEFLLFRKLFERHGIDTVIADPSELEIQDGKLIAGGKPIDLVYNRLTDFALELPASAWLHQAYLENLAVVTPHPRAHALYADKRNLARLTDRLWLEQAGVPSETRQALIGGIAATRILDPAHADQLWTERKKLFFKPVSGFGSKAVYRGDKLTRRVWEEILASRYVAQELVPPAEQPVDHAPGAGTLKSDVRHYVYGGETQLVSARLYQGQTTNFRTPGGGFSPVFLTEPTVSP